MGTELNRFRSLLHKKHLKLTSERRKIFEEALRMKKHFDADGFYDLLRERGLEVCRDTVYRTLPLLLEANVIQKSVGDGRREYFERTGSRGHHDHMICIQCGRVLEFHSQELESLQVTICRQKRFQLRFHDHRLFGYCENCQN